MGLDLRARYPASGWETIYLAIRTISSDRGVDCELESGCGCIEFDCGCGNHSGDISSAVSGGSRIWTAAETGTEDERSAVVCAGGSRVVGCCGAQQGIKEWVEQSVLVAGFRSHRHQ